MLKTFLPWEGKNPKIFILFIFEFSVYSVLALLIDYGKVI
jgi:hypothetical protein